VNLRDALERRRKDTRFVLGVLALLLVVLGAAYWFLLQSQDLPSFLVTNKLLLFVLFYLDIVLILAIVLVLVRTVAKLLLERRSRVLGSQFKFRLLTSLVGLTLVPVLLVFLYATELLEKSVDRWFRTPGVDALRQGANVAQELRRTLEATTVSDAQRILLDLDFDGDLDAERRSRIAAGLSAELEPAALDLAVAFRGTEFIHGVLTPRQGLEVLPDLPRAFLEEAASNGTATRWSTTTGVVRNLVLGAVALDQEVPAAIVVVGRVIDEQLANDSERLIMADQSLRRAELQTAEIKTSQLLLFLLITLLVLLTTSWIGLRLARRFTVPIQALAEGTRRIAEGDLAHRVEVEADDELGVLVDSFNAMTQDLDRNKRLLEARNRELKAANDHIEGERALLLAVLQGVAAGVVAIDAEGVVFLCNGAALRMVRQREGDIVGRPLAEAWGDQERRALLDAMPPMDAVGARPSEVRLVLGGTWRSLELSAATLPGRGGEAGGQVLVLEDLTELVKAQKLAAWSEAARRIAHEIKNPLTPIQLAAERLVHQYRSAPESFEQSLTEAVATVVREVQHLKQMVDSFSRFARMPSPRPTTFDARTLVEETLRLYRGVKPGVEIRAELEPAAPRVWGDRDQLRGALVNLIDNAFEATEAPGEVVVRVEVRSRVWVLSVSDTGKGIGVDDASKLFLPHFSTKARGTGLGLAIVHRTVSEHEGTIRVEDNLPRGTSFVIEIPLPQEAQG
jgi:two-component system nitrogen regulation sensor histidine kinase NtrY